MQVKNQANTKILNKLNLAGHWPNTKKDLENEKLRTQEWLAKSFEARQPR